MPVHRPGGGAAELSGPAIKPEDDKDARLWAAIAAGTSMKIGVLRGERVISLAGGVKVGTLLAVLVDTLSPRIAAPRSRTPSNSNLVPSATIRGSGPATVPVHGNAVTERAAGQGPWNQFLGLSDLMGLRVVNCEGAILGRVTDLAKAPEDGRLIQVEVRNGSIMGFGGARLTVPAHAIRGVGPKHIEVQVPLRELVGSHTSP